MLVGGYLGFLCLREWGLSCAAIRKPGCLAESFTPACLCVGVLLFRHRGLTDGLRSGGRAEVTALGLSLGPPSCLSACSFTSTMLSRSLWLHSETCCWAVPLLQLCSRSVLCGPSGLWLFPVSLGFSVSVISRANWLRFGLGLHQIFRSDWEERTCWPCGRFRSVNVEFLSIYLVL